MRTRTINHTVSKVWVGMTIIIGEIRVICSWLRVGNVALEGRSEDGDTCVLSRRGSLWMCVVYLVCAAKRFVIVFSRFFIN